MFYKKEIEELSNRLSALEDTTECEECGCLVRESRAFDIIDERASCFIVSGPITRHHYYCKRCKPNYDIIDKDGNKVKLIEKVIK